MPESRAITTAFTETMATGYAVVFNTWTTIGNDFLERIAPGALSASISRNDVLALWNHDLDRVLGRTASDTLRLAEDQRGLHFDLDLDPRTPDGQTALGTVDRGDVVGCSFSFVPLAELWTDSGSGLPMRTITEAEIFEISLCPMPAYETTTVALAAPQRSANRVNAARRRAEAKHRLRGILA